MALLEVSGLTKNFGGLAAVSHLDFCIESGELLSIIGPNGSGKSTVFNLVSGVYKPTAGIVKFNGNNITESKSHRIAREGISRTFQRITIFDKGTVLENAVIGQILHAHSGFWGVVFRGSGVKREENRMREKAREILGFVGLLDKEDEIAGNISQEAQRRLSIAMALSSKPRILLLDEPTGGVNLEEISGLIDLVQKIRNSGVTICLIEHKMSVVMNISDRIIVLNYGEKIAEGRPEEVARNEQVVKAYLGAKYVTEGH